MKKIHYAIIDGNEIAIKQNEDHFKIIRPIKNSDGSINWKNLISGGNWMNLVWVGLIVTIISLAILEYVGNLKLLAECLKYNTNFGNILYLPKT